LPVIVVHIDLFGDDPTFPFYLLSAQGRIEANVEENVGGFSKIVICRSHIIASVFLCGEGIRRRSERLECARDCSVCPASPRTPETQVL
jgi:hypothetical protein